jgi:predicted nucleic acid-binding protein
VSSNTRAIPDARTPGEAIQLLTQLRGSGQHHFWEDGVTLTAGPFDIFSRVVGHRQVTDAHLLTLALHHCGCFATFDRALQELAGSHRESVVLIA